MVENKNPFDDTSQKVAELLEEIDESEDLKESKFEKILEELNLTKASFFKYVILIVLSIFLFNYFTTERSTQVKDSSVESQIVESETEKSFFDKLFSDEDSVTEINTTNPSSLDPVNQIGVLPALKIRNIQTFSVSSKIAKSNTLSLVLETYLLSYKKMKTLYDVANISMDEAIPFSKIDQALDDTFTLAEISRKSPILELQEDDDSSFESLKKALLDAKVAQDRLNHTNNLYLKGSKNVSPNEHAKNEFNADDVLVSFHEVYLYCCGLCIAQLNAKRGLERKKFPEETGDEA